jgi:hypothetical protein
MDLRELGGNDQPDSLGDNGNGGGGQDYQMQTAGGESMYAGNQTAYGGGQTAYDAGKTPLAIHTPSYHQNETQY